MNAHTPSACTALAAAALLLAESSLFTPAAGAEPATTAESIGAASSAQATGNVAPTIEEELLQAGISPTIPELSAVLQDRDIDPKLRALSAIGLGHTEDRTVVPVLLGYLEDPEEEVRDAALAALFGVPDPRAVPYMKAILDDESTRGVGSADHRRGNAMSVLSLIRTEEAIRIVLRTALDPLETVRVRTNALVTLARKGRPVASDDLRPLLADPSPAIRIQAAAAMARTGDRTVVPILASAVVDPANPDYLRRDALTELADLTRESFGYMRNVPPPEEWAEIVARVDAWWQLNRRYYE